MDYRFVFTKQAQDDLSNMEDLLVRKILRKLRFFVDSGKPMIFAKKLKSLDDYFRFRVGDYRVIFRKDQKSGQLVVLVVLRVGRWKSVYKGKLL